MSGYSEKYFISDAYIPFPPDTHYHILSSPYFMVADTTHFFKVFLCPFTSNDGCVVTSWITHLPDGLYSMFLASEKVASLEADVFLYDVGWSSSFPNGGAV